MTDAVDACELAATMRELKGRQDILDVIVRESRGRDRHVNMLLSLDVQIARIPRTIAPA